MKKLLAFFIAAVAVFAVSCQKPGKLSMAKRSDLSVSGHEVRQYEVQCGICSHHGRNIPDRCDRSVSAEPGKERKETIIRAEAGSFNAYLLSHIIKRRTANVIY